jgi:hypothetical protein
MRAERITHILVAALTGAVTSEGIGKRYGDASFESSNRRLLQLSHPALKPKGLGFGKVARLSLSGSG